MVAIAAAVLVAFIGGLYFITHHKKEEAEAMQNRQAAGNGLPPKPEERWRYIKELESRQPGVRAPTEPTAGGEVMKPEQLTDEQRQLLAQMQADMRQQPTQLTEVPWNEQTPAQRQQTLQRQRLAQQQQQAQQQQWTQTQPQAVQQQPRVQQPKPVQQQQPKQTASNQQPYQDLLQTPAHTNTTQPRTQAAAPVTRVEEAPKAAEKKDDRSWMIQCGSFKGAALDHPATIVFLLGGFRRFLHAGYRRGGLRTWLRGIGMRRRLQQILVRLLVRRGLLRLLLLHRLRLLDARLLLHGLRLSLRPLLLLRLLLLLC